MKSWGLLCFIIFVDEKPSEQINFKSPTPFKGNARVGLLALQVSMGGALKEAHSANLPILGPVYFTQDNEMAVVPKAPLPPGLVRARVQEGVPPPLCAGRCASPPAGPVCAFDATGTARTFATLCELEAVSCRESTYYAITGLGEC